MKMFRFPRMCVFGFALTAVLTGVKDQALAQEPETFTYDTPQRLVCLRNGEVGLDRPAAFRLKIVKSEDREDYSYRDGSYGGRPGKFAIRPDQVTCTVTPAEGPAASPVREFNEVSQFQCVDNGVLVVRPVFTERIIERGTENSLIYEYWIHNGPPSKQTIMLSPMGGQCLRA